MHPISQRLQVIADYSSKFARHDVSRGFVFTALHVMQTRYSDENSVCPSVCLSVRLSVCHTRDP